MIDRRRTKKQPTVRCAIYTRKSTEDGLDQDFNSLDAQREAGEAFIMSQKSEGWTCLPERYDDGGFSGGNMERPALRRLISDIEAGKVDCIVVYKVDRLSRSLLDFARILETLEQHNVAFVAVTQHFNSANSMGRLTLNILLSFAQFEREIIGERIRDKIAAQKRKGKWAGGTPVLGYDVDRSNASPKLVINATEASRVRQIFALYLELGSLLPVVDELDNRGWCNKAWTTKKGSPKGGHPFDRGSLYALLTNPIYIGKVRHKQDVFDGEHEPIIDADVFYETQARLQQNCRNTGGRVRNRHGALLRGLLVCKACRKTMTHTFTGKDSKRYRYYTCTRAIKRGRKRCPSQSLPAAEVEAMVIDQIRGIADDPGLRAEVYRAAKKHVESRLSALRIEQKDLKSELTRHNKNIRKIAESTDVEEASRTFLVDLHDRVAQAKARLAELRAEIRLVEQDRLDEEDVDAAFADFDAVWNELTLREQTSVLHLLISRVEFDATDSSIAVSLHPTAIQTLHEIHSGAPA